MEQEPGGDEGIRVGQHEDTERRRGQRFLFGAMVFNVDKALDLVAKDIRDDKPVGVAAWATFFGFDIPEGQGAALFAPRHFDPDYAMTTDLDNPVLVATLRNSDGELLPLLIDGTHRIYKAYTLGVPTLPSLVLNEAETVAIRDDPFVRSTVHWPNRGRSPAPGDAGAPEGGAT